MMNLAKIDRMDRDEIIEKIGSVYFPQSNLQSRIGHSIKTKDVTYQVRA
jgi:hypothetical protein